MESTVLNQHGSDRTSALIQTSLDDRTSSKSVGVSLEFEHVCGKANHLKQGVDALAGLSGNRNADNVAAPLLANEVVLGQLFLYLVGVCAFLILLLMATMMETPAAFAWLIASTVCGMIPSSAATTRIAISVTLAPRALIEVNAS